MNTWRDFRLVRVLDAHVVSGQRTKEERMRNRFVTSLLTLGAVAVFLLGMAPAAEAELICKKIRPSGPKVCYEATSGSVNCLAIAQGVAGKLAKECDAVSGEGECFIVVKCSIFGTVPEANVYDENPLSNYETCGEILFGQFPGGTDYFPYPETEPSQHVLPNCEPPCYLRGDADCLNPDGKYNPQGEAFVGGPLTSGSATATCDSGGTCTSRATITGGSGEGICPNHNWTLDFTPEEFFGELSFCPGNYENFIDLSDPNALVPEDVGECADALDLGRCCQTDKRKNGSCFRNFQDGEPTEGQPGYIQTYCSLPAQCYQMPWGENNPCFDSDGNIKKNVTYDCKDCDDIDCQYPNA
jgi:hypothetical protein